MGTVIFRRGTSVAYADAWVERTWKLPATGEAGTGRIRLPYSAAAASSTYIDTDGGSVVEIASEAGCGTWRGIVTQIDYDSTMVELQVIQIQSLLGRRIIHWEGAFIHAVPAGYVVGRILRECLPGLPHLWCTQYPSGSNDPLVRNYQMDGQDAWSALLEMMDAGNCELFIDSETGEVTWEGALAGDILGPLLIADGNFHQWRYSALVGTRTSEVTVKSGIHRHTVSDGTAAVAFPAQTLITAGVSSSLGASAEAELVRSRGAQVLITGSVDSTLWSLREREIVRVALPQAGFGGTEHPCRLLARTLSDDSAFMPLELQVIDENVGVRVAPPMRAGSSSTQGPRGKGSWAARQIATQREAWRTHRRAS